MFTPKRRWIKAMLFTLASVGAGVPVATQAQGAAEHRALGERALAALDPATALSHFEAALALEPGNAPLLGDASRAAIDLGEGAAPGERRTGLFRTGEQYARRAVAAAPQDAEAHFHLARALGRYALTVGARERVKLATAIREEALTIVRLAPGHPGGRHVLGAWHAGVMRLSGVERFVAKRVLGDAVFGEASWAEAVAQMERAVALDPERLSHRLALGTIYRDLGEPAKAREQLLRVQQGPVREYNDPLYKREAEAALRTLPAAR